MRRSRGGLACAAWVALTCASAPAPEPAEDSLATLRTREAPPLPMVEIAAEDGSFRARAEGKAVFAPQREAEMHIFGIDIGSANPIACTVHQEELDLASALFAFSHSTFEATAARVGGIEQKRIAGVDAGTVGSSPFLAVEWLYGVRQEGTLRVGQIKHFVAWKGAGTLYCQHDEVGYSASFRRIVEGLLRELEIGAKPEQDPFYEEITRMSVGEMHIGVQRVALTRDADGDVRIDVRASLVVPADNGSLQTNDSYGVEFARPDGSLINQTHVEVENAELASHLELEPIDPEGWTVRGTFQQKPLDTRLAPDRRMAISWLGEALALRRAIESQGVGARVLLARWVPDADPTRLVEETISIRERVADDRFRSEVVIGGVQAEILADRSGSAAAGSMRMGFIEMHFERIFVAGQF